MSTVQVVDGKLCDMLTLVLLDGLCSYILSVKSHNSQLWIFTSGINKRYSERFVETGNTLSTLNKRESLRAEKAGEREVPSSCNFDPSYLADLQEMIERFNSSNRTNEFKRISTQLLHVESLSSRIVCDTSELIHHRLELMELQKRLTQDLIRIYESSIKDDASCQHLSLLYAPVPLLPKIVDIPAQSLVDPQADSSEGLLTVENLILSENRQEFGGVGDSRLAAFRRLFTERRTSIRLNIERCPQHERNEETASGLSGSASSINDENFPSFDRFSTLANAQGVAPSDTKVCDITNKPFEPRHRRISFGTHSINPSIPTKKPHPNLPGMNSSEPFEDLIRKMSLSEVPVMSNDKLPSTYQPREDYLYSGLYIGRWRLQYNGIGSVTSFRERLQE
ncbi:hypothetical protein HHI36_022334 [Cryptolaemus montrouzieri]|uniref:Uncharacterized protein n=1 Tax=Cryptolaemus montrouzieri TaxID=559131 RepID=A0ABD2N0S7_9CUCU